MQIAFADIPGLNLYLMLFDKSEQVWNGSAFASTGSTTRATAAIAVTYDTVAGTYGVEQPTGSWPLATIARFYLQGTIGSYADTDPVWAERDLRVPMIRQGFKVL